MEQNRRKENETEKSGQDRTERKTIKLFFLWQF